MNIFFYFIFFKLRISVGVVQIVKMEASVRLLLTSRNASFVFITYRMNLRNRVPNDRKFSQAFRELDSQPVNVH